MLFSNGLHESTVMSNDISQQIIRITLTVCISGFLMHEIGISSNAHYIFDSQFGNTNAVMN